MRVLHLAPHPDDEILGAGATLLALVEAGHDVHNLAVSLGRRPERDQRRGELEAACAHLGLALELLEPPLDMSHGEGDDLAAAEARLTSELAERRTGWDLIIAPALHDRHPGHALVGRAALGALGIGSGPARLWSWCVWGNLPFPTMITGFDDRRLEALASALRHHRSQLERNDLERALRGKRAVDAVLGPELVFGTGAERLEQPNAELLCELIGADGRWRLGSPTLLDARPE